MKKHSITIVFCLLIIELAYSQSYCNNKYDYIWLLGDADLDTIKDEYGGSEINFNSQPPTFNYHSKAVHSPFQNTSMSTKDGEFLFYSNGCSILNTFNIEVENGDSLNPGESYDLNCPLDGYVGFQNMVSLPDQEDNSLYYIFHIDKVFNHNKGAPFVVQSQHAYLTTLQISSIEPFGSIIDKNYILLDDTSMLGSPVSAIKTADALSWWIITPDRWKNGFHLFKVDHNVKTYVGFQTIGEKTDPDAPGGQGKFSPNGDHFAWYHPKNGLFLYDFNRKSGTLNNFRQIIIDNDTSIIGGCEFSPSSQFIYVNHIKSLYQIDILDEDVQSSVFKIADYDGFIDPLPTSFFYLERTPDNRIYMNTPNGTQYLHVINEPNKKGIECNFEQHSIKLPTINNFTFPHFPNYRLGALDEPLCDSFIVNTSYNYTDLVKAPYKLVPNPASNYLQLAPTSENQYIQIQCTILDLQGRILHVFYDDRIDLTNISPGLYFLSVSSSNKIVQIFKFIKLE